MTATERSGKGHRGLKREYIGISAWAPHGQLSRDGAWAEEDSSEEEKSGAGKAVEARPGPSCTFQVTGRDLSPEYLSGTDLLQSRERLSTQAQGHMALHARRGLRMQRSPGEYPGEESGEVCNLQLPWAGSSFLPRQGCTSPHPQGIAGASDTGTSTFMRVL